MYSTFRRQIHLPRSMHIGHFEVETWKCCRQMWTNKQSLVDHLLLFHSFFFSFENRKQNSESAAKWIPNTMSSLTSATSKMQSPQIRNQRTEGKIKENNNENWTCVGVWMTRRHVMSDILLRASSLAWLRSIRTPTHATSNTHSRTYDASLLLYCQLSQTACIVRAHTP